MTPSELVTQYLSTCHTMQIASYTSDQPWICSVWFVADDEHNLYWASLPTRRHSQEIQQQAKVACAIVVSDQVDTPVIGIQIEGIAVQQAAGQYDRAIVEKYAQAFRRSDQWVANFMAGTTHHKLYKLTPSSIYLFDEQHFPGGERQKIA